MRSPRGHRCPGWLVHFQPGGRHRPIAVFCGTDAARHTNHAKWTPTWSHNPLAILTMLGAVAITARRLAGILTPRWLNSSFNWTTRRCRRAIAMGFVVLVALDVRHGFAPARR